MDRDKTEMMRRYWKRGYQVGLVKPIIDGECEAKDFGCDGRHLLLPGVFGESFSRRQALSALGANPRANLALFLGCSRLVALEVHHPVEGCPPLSPLLQDALDRPTVSFAIGAQVRVWLFAVPPGVSVRSSTGWVHPCVTVRGFDSWVVIPPGRNMAGESLNWNVGASLLERDPAVLPSELLSDFATWSPERDATRIRIGNGNDQLACDLCGDLDFQGPGEVAILNADEVRSVWCRSCFEANLVVKLTGFPWAGFRRLDEHLEVAHEPSGDEWRRRIATKAVTISHDHD